MNHETTPHTTGSTPQESNSPPLDFITGQMSRFDAYRLRHRAAKDTALARELAELAELREDLQQFTQAKSVAPAPKWPVPPRPLRLTVTLFGGITMSRRIFVGSYAFLLLCIAGTIVLKQAHTPKTKAARIEVQRDVPYIMSSFGGGKHSGDKTFGIKSEFRGRVRITVPNNHPEFPNWPTSPTFDDPLLGRDPNAPLFFSYREMNPPNWPDDAPLSEAPYDFVRELRGLGKHEILDNTGKHLAVVEMLAWSEEDEEQIRRETVAALQARKDFYQSPECFAVTCERDAASEVEQEEGVTAGRQAESGIAWKVYGYGHITAQYLTQKPETREIDVYTYAGLKERFVDNLTGTHVAKWAAEQVQQISDMIPKRDAEPVIYFAFAGDAPTENREHQMSYDPPVKGVAVQRVPKDGGYLVDTAGHWKATRYRGKRTGYGRHEIRDENGKVVLILTVRASASHSPTGR